MAGRPTPIPDEQRYHGLRAFLLRQEETVSHITMEQPELVPQQVTPLFFLVYPWFRQPQNQDEDTLLRTRRNHFAAAGFDGSQAIRELGLVLEVDRHLRECCPSSGALAHLLDLHFILPAIQLRREGTGTQERIDSLYAEFETLIYGQGRFRSISLSHLFNFTAEEPSLDFGIVKVAKLESPLVARIIGEATPYSFFHPPNTGDYFIVNAQEGPCDDVIAWLSDKHTVAVRFAQVLQYYKDGVVHVDYTVPHFFPEWANEIRKWGIFLWGSPRRLPYMNGERSYHLTGEDVRGVSQWWTAYHRGPVSRRMADEQQELRQATIRAGDYYEVSHARDNPVDRLIALAIALESLLSPEDQTEISYRMSQYAGQLAGRTAEERLEVFSAVRQLYKKRSKLFHGQYNVHDYYAGRFVTHQECDRWSPVVRKVILRMLTLFLRGENSRKRILDALHEATLNAEQGEILRRNSDVDAYLRETLAEPEQ